MKFNFLNRSWQMTDRPNLCIMWCLQPGSHLPSITPLTTTVWRRGGEDSETPRVCMEGLGLCAQIIS